MKLVLGDDHPVVISGLCNFFESDSRYNVVSTASNGREAVEMYKLHHPDFIILDISMEEMNGLDAGKKIIEYDKSALILYYSINLNRSEIYSCYKLGARGFVSKESSMEKLCEALDIISQGKLFFDDQFTEADYNKYIESYQQSNKGDRNLSFREKDILHLVAKGFSNIEISEKLCISVKTIEDHRRNIRKKKNIVGNTDFMKFAIEFAKNDSEKK